MSGRNLRSAYSSRHRLGVECDLPATPLRRTVGDLFRGRTHCYRKTGLTVTAQLRTHHHPRLMKYPVGLSSVKNQLLRASAENQDVKSGTVWWPPNWRTSRGHPTVGVAPMSSVLGTTIWSRFRDHQFQRTGGETDSSAVAGCGRWLVASVRQLQRSRRTALAELFLLALPVKHTPSLAVHDDGMGLCSRMLAATEYVQRPASCDAVDSFFHGDTDGAPSTCLFISRRIRWSMLCKDSRSKSLRMSSSRLSCPPSAWTVLGDPFIKENAGHKQMLGVRIGIWAWTDLCMEWG